MNRTNAEPTVEKQAKVDGPLGRWSPAEYHAFFYFYLESVESIASNDPDAEQIIRCLCGAVDACEKLLDNHERHGCPDRYRVGLDGCTFCQDADGIRWVLQNAESLLSSSLYDFGNDVVDALHGYARAAGIPESEVPPAMILVPIDEDLVDLAREVSGGRPGTYLSGLLRPLLLHEADGPVTASAVVAGRSAG